MAYEWERDEWRSAVRATSDAEQQRMRDEERRALGICGDPSDAVDEVDDDDDL